VGADGKDLVPLLAREGHLHRQHARVASPHRERGDGDALLKIGLRLVRHGSIRAEILWPLSFEYFLLRRVGFDQGIKRSARFDHLARVRLERHLFAGDEIVLVPAEALNGVGAR
jgi:hypothetical protein